MARTLYAADPSTFTVARSGRIVGGVSGQVLMPDGAVVDDLAAAQYDGTAWVQAGAVTQVTSDDDGLLAVFGPDGYDGALYLAVGDLPPLLLRPHTVGVSLAPGSVTAEKIATSGPGAVTPGLIGAAADTRVDEVVQALDTVAATTVDLADQIDALSPVTAAMLDPGALGYLGPVQAFTSSGTITATSSRVSANCTAENIALALPLASAFGIGRLLVVRKIGGAGKSLYLNRAGADLIAGKTSVGWSTAARGTLILEATSTGWSVLTGTASDESVGRRVWQWSDALAESSADNTVGFQLTWADTGWRDIRSLCVAPAVVSVCRIRRVMHRIEFQVSWQDGQTNPFRVPLLTLPAGFYPRMTPHFVVPYDATTAAVRNVAVGVTGAVTYGGATQAGNFHGELQWATSQAWPTALPGVADGVISTLTVRDNA